jgi:hypothetical protein
MLLFAANPPYCPWTRALKPPAASARQHADFKRSARASVRRWRSSSGHRRRTPGLPVSGPPRRQRALKPIRTAECVRRCRLPEGTKRLRIED